MIANAPDGAGLGTIGLHLAAADTGLAEVGYWLAREARGRGAVTTAVQLVSRWAFTVVGIDRLSLQTAPENAREPAPRLDANARRPPAQRDVLAAGHRREPRGLTHAGAGRRRLAACCLGGTLCEGARRQRMPSQPGERDRRAGDLLGQAPGAEGAADRKAALYMARAEAARAAKEAGYKSPLRRLIGRLLPGRTGR